MYLCIRLTGKKNSIFFFASFTMNSILFFFWFESTCGVIRHKIPLREWFSIDLSKEYLMIFKNGSIKHICSIAASKQKHEFLFGLRIKLFTQNIFIYFFTIWTKLVWNEKFHDLLNEKKRKKATCACIQLLLSSCQYEKY